ncbi:MAG TPA: hypothetical protein V6C76_00660 [Drouetiella sp.]
MVGIVCGANGVRDRTVRNGTTTSARQHDDFSTTTARRLQHDDSTTTAPRQHDDFSMTTSA